MSIEWQGESSEGMVNSLKWEEESREGTIDKVP